MKEYLKKARDLIADKKNWCHGYLAMDSRGRVVDSEGDLASRFCAYGSLHHVCKDSDSYTTAVSYIRNAAKDLYGHTPAFVNDVMGHKEVMKVYDRAIEMCEGE